MIARTCLLLSLIAGGVQTTQAQTPPYVGTWALDTAKSQLAGMMLTIEKTPAGRMHYDYSGISYDFDLDGKDHPVPDGSTISVRVVDPTTWEIISRMNGKTLSTGRMTVSGNSLASTQSLTRADGSSAQATLTFNRVSGGPGFLGKWRSTSLTGTPASMQISAGPQNEVVVALPELKMVMRGSFDGKDYPMEEAGVPSKQMVAFEKVGATGFKMTTKLNGKPIYVDVMTVSADGKQLTDDGNTMAGNEPTKAVYNRR